MDESVSEQDPIEVFKADLASLSVKDVVRKYISTGMPRAFSEQEYFELRSIVSREFCLHPSSVVVVGSSRVGFSLNPRHRYRLVKPGSDIDLAIVSPERFDDYWDRVFDVARSNIAWRKSDGLRFRHNLFNGWIDPRFLPSTSSFEPARQWVRFFDGLVNSRKYGLRQISARLYRTWDRLEAYQERSVLACKPTGIKL